MIPAALTFSFEAAKQHLISADSRFDDVFKRLPCGPYEKLDPVDPFKSLVTSILGQQISWLAARSITHKFIRLYDPSLPEKPPQSSDNVGRVAASFPTPSQVAQTPIPVLRGVGLSGRKAEYVIDLATRFADGRLSAEEMANASDEELAEMLIAVRGIGMWTVHMFSMFSMRRPDVLPVGDLGVQRGVVRWFLSWHDPRTSASPVKLRKNDTAARPETKSTEGSLIDKLIDVAADEGLPIGQSSRATKTGLARDEDANPFLTSGGDRVVGSAEVLAAVQRSEAAAAETAKEVVGGSTGMPSFPEPFTPSIQRTLYKGLNAPPKLPEGLSVSILKSRLEGKKVKGAILTPNEMEALTEGWKPYRSLGSYYMWALAEQ